MTPTSSVDQVAHAFARMDEVDGLVASVCTRDHAAPEQARQRDDEARAGRSRGPLHGRPVLVKDNIDTADLPTTAGSMALAGLPHPSRDAALVRRLRDAGMVVVGKANLSEWANIRDQGSTSGWSAYGGLTRNPYGLNRSAGGSSSGSGAALGARITPFAVGTETDGSITCPAAFNGCVGFKPTVGLVPTDGVVPVSASQDTPGPMAMTVRDAAALLGVLAGDGTDYASHAVEGRLAGKRIGVPRRDFWGYSSHADGHAERAVALLAAEGATIVDHTDLDSLADLPEQDELLVMLAELRDGLPRYLATRAGDGPRTLADVVAFNREHADVELAHFGQELFEQGARGPRGRQRGVRRGAGPLPGPRPRRRHRRGAPGPRPRRAGHPVVRAGDADRPGEPRGARRVVHRPRGDGGLPAADRAGRARGRAPGGGVVLGHGRQRDHPGRDRARLRGRPRPGHRPAAGADVHAVRLSAAAQRSRPAASFIRAVSAGVTGTGRPGRWGRPKRPVTAIACPSSEIR